MTKRMSVHPGPTHLAALVGSGDRIGLFTLPFLLGGLVLNVVYPSLFDVGGPSTAAAWREYRDSVKMPWL
jgi:hypothetical protein